MCNGLRTRSKGEFWADFLLYFSAFFILLFALGDRGLWAAEGRWAQITREMLLTKDFFHPTIGGRAYFDKPLLTYWLIAGASFITGSLNEWVVRLPSALSGVAVIWATKSIGTRLWSAKVGRVAGWILLTSYGFLFWSRTGTAEAENLAAVILAVAWYWYRRDRTGFITFLVFYAIIFLGALTKGLTAVIVPVLAVLPDLMMDRRWRALLKPLHLLALFIAISLYLSPFVYASMTNTSSYQTEGLSLVFRENVVRYFRPFDHKGPIYLYFYIIPALLFPWSPLFVSAIAGAIKIRKDLDDRSKWLLRAGVLIFIFFTLSGSRRSYYILPILPFCALLTSVLVIAVSDQRVRDIIRLGAGVQSGLLFGMIIFEFFVPLSVFVPKSIAELSFPSGFFVATVVIGISALTVKLIADKRLALRYSKSNEYASILSCIMVASIVFGGYFCWQQTILGVSRTERPFVQKLEEKIAGWEPERIALFRRNDPTFHFYLKASSPIRLLDNPADLRDFLANEPSGVLITQQMYMSEVISEVSGDFHTEPDMSEEIRGWDSESSRKRKWVAWILKKPVASQELMDKEQ